MQSRFGCPTAVPLPVDFSLGQASPLTFLPSAGWLGQLWGRILGWYLLLPRATAYRSSADPPSRTYRFYLSERLPACPDTVETSLSPPGHNVSGHVHGLRVPSHQAFKACLDQFGLYLQISWGLCLNLMDLMAATHETSPRTPAEPGSVPAEVLPVEGLVQPRAGPDLPSVSL